MTLTSARCKACGPKAISVPTSASMAKNVQVQYYAKNTVQLSQLLYKKNGSNHTSFLIILSASSRFSKVTNP